MSHETNSKGTAALVIQVISVIAAIATPLILMYSKLNALEVMFGERLREIETQFRASDQLRNVQFSDQQRTNSVLWNAGPLGDKAKYPEGPFFHPDIAK